MAVTLERRQAGQMAADRELSSRAAAEAYIGGVCFKLGPPGLIGAELEWLTTHGECPASGPTAAPRPPLELLADALGPYAPRSIAPDSPALALPGGSRVTIEPGGQIELSSAPYATAAQLVEQLRADAEMLRKLLETQCVGMVSAAADAGRRARRVLRLPRYQAMERYLAGLGPFGKLMMCNTAATQVSVDAGTDPAEAGARWTALYAVGPALSAAFACSPELRGAPAGEWASQRMRTWLRLDHSRTRPPVEDWADPIAGYARWALDAPLLCVRSREPATGASSSAGEWDRGLGTGAADCSWAAPPGATFADWLSGALDDEVGRRPDRSDLDYHLTTMFPPVRPSGHLEVRYLDAQPDESWTVPIDVIDALMSSPAAVAEATGIAGPTAGRWLDAARCGLADREIRAAAAELLDAAATHAATPAAADAIHAAAQRCRSARQPSRLESGSAP